jgi:hypothetical protein
VIFIDLTMMLSRIPSVKDTYFQHKVLTKVHGKPTYETLQNLSTELKASNAGSVPSTLGGRRTEWPPRYYSRSRKGCAVR